MRVEVRITFSVFCLPLQNRLPVRDMFPRSAGPAVQYRGWAQSWSHFRAAGRDGKPWACPGAGAGGFSTLESGPAPTLCQRPLPLRGNREDARTAPPQPEADAKEKRSFDSSWALWLRVLVALAEGSRRGVGGEGRSGRRGAQRIVLLPAVTGLRYQVRTDSGRRKENHHLFFKQGSSPALPDSSVPRANSALLQGCELTKFLLK